MQSGQISTPTSGTHHHTYLREQPHLLPTRDPCHIPQAAGFTRDTRQVELTEPPWFVVPLNDIEVAHFERVVYIARAQQGALGSEARTGMARTLL